MNGEVPQMKFRAPKFVSVVLLLNSIFWLWFWIDVSRHATFYVDLAITLKGAIDRSLIPTRGNTTIPGTQVLK